MKPLFIVFEGIDGSGTSTQATLLHHYFTQENQPAVLSPEPTEGVIGKLIRQGMQTPLFAIDDPVLFDQQMAYLFAADRHHHLYNQDNGVFKLIREDHCHVITTRYYFSSFAYNGNTPEDWALIQRLNQNFPQPDLVIYCDLPVEMSLLRIQDRSIKEIYETQEKLQKVRQNYLDLFRDYSGKFLLVDARHPPEEIHQTVVLYLQKAGF